MIYYLIGMMGSGKTWYGGRLAEKLKVPFIDLDQVIEQQEERSINAIFETDGEAYFRDIEAKHLRELTDDYENAVISTGGGTPCYHDNLMWMRQTGFTIYLRVPVEILVSRLQAASKDRPLLNGVSDHQMHGKITSLLEKRQSFYLQAHETLDVEDQY
jgi:shikimate kinase